jgi:hypothetical protein
MQSFFKHDQVLDTNQPTSDQSNNNFIVDWAAN